MRSFSRAPCAGFALRYHLSVLCTVAASAGRINALVATACESYLLLEQSHHAHTVGMLRLEEVAVGRVPRLAQARAVPVLAESCRLNAKV